MNGHEFGQAVGIEWPDGERRMGYYMRSGLRGKHYIAAKKPRKGAAKAAGWWVLGERPRRDEDNPMETPWIVEG